MDTAFSSAVSVRVDLVLSDREDVIWRQRAPAFFLDRCAPRMMSTGACPGLFCHRTAVCATCASHQLALPVSDISGECGCTMVLSRTVLA
ncbi:hypothetical protein MMPV_008188 [Pyropia vietnamensis]